MKLLKILTISHNWIYLPSQVFSSELKMLLMILHNGGKMVIFKNSFINGKPIKINGLIWMGNKEFMLKQVYAKNRKWLFLSQT